MGNMGKAGQQSISLGVLNVLNEVKAIIKKEQPTVGAIRLLY